MTFLNGGLLDNSTDTEKKKMVKVKLIPTEVYSRVVGYYRPVQNWNKGKSEEFKSRAHIDANRDISDFNL